MRPLVVMIGGSVVSWLGVTAAGGAGLNPELAFGMAAPLAGAAVSWRVVERTHASAPERVMQVLIAGFAAKALFYAGCVGLLAALGWRPRPFVISFTIYFVALHVIEALYLRQLFSCR